MYQKNPTRMVIFLLENMNVTNYAVGYSYFYWYMYDYTYAHIDSKIIKNI